uniref:BACK domain-containing protein n=1 Tax=Rhabditophanes sp. KR3021 TaxID=114890 RepID=A0AC35TXN5_9BILA
MINISEVLNDAHIQDRMYWYIDAEDVKPVGLLKYCNAKGLTDLCSLLKENIQEYVEVYVSANYFDDDDWETFTEVMEDSFITRTCQETVLQCFFGWINYKFEERKEYCVALLQKINFRFIKTETIRKLFDGNKKVFEIDGVSCFIYVSLYKRGLSINPNDQPTDILMIAHTWDGEVGEMSKIFKFNIFTRIFDGFGVVSEDDIDAVGYEIIEDDLLIFQTTTLCKFKKFNLFTRKAEEFTINSPMNYRYQSTCQINGQIIVFRNNGVSRVDPNKMELYNVSNFRDQTVSGEPIVFNNSIYIVGGGDSRPTYRYDIREGLLESCCFELFDGYDSSVCLFDNNIIKVGGIFAVGNDYITHGHCEIFDPRVNTWREVSALPVVLSNGKCCQIDNTVQLFGGHTADEPSNNIHIFDILSGNWSLSQAVTEQNYEICSLNLF